MKTSIANLLSLLFILTSSYYINAQEISLEQCYQWAKEHHPLAAKTNLLKTQNEWEIQSLQAKKYPQLNTEWQATYQSDVVSLPISLPNLTIESPDKDQYKATFTAGQLLYNGGLIDAQKELKRKQLASAEKEIDIQLYALKEQVNKLYFSILLTQKKIEILNKNASLLQQKKQEIHKMIDAGVAYMSMLQPIEIKLLELQQNQVEATASLSQLWAQLAKLTGESLGENASLLMPKDSLINKKQRPELDLFDLQTGLIDTQADLLKKQTLPAITAFGTAGYGKPGLNMLDNSWQDFYMAGIKLQWNVFDFGSNKKQRHAMVVSKDLIENQKQVFLWQQDLAVKNYQTEIEKIQKLITTDKEIVAYRKKMLQTAEKKLKHELITPGDYTEAITDLQDAEIKLQTHEIQLALTITNLNTILYD